MITPTCNEYWNIYYSYTPATRDEWRERCRQHKENCEQCRKRAQEINEIAKNAMIEEEDRAKTNL